MFEPVRAKRSPCKHHGDEGQLPNGMYALCLWRGKLSISQGGNSLYLSLKKGNWKTVKKWSDSGKTKCFFSFHFWPVLPLGTVDGVIYGVAELILNIQLLRWRRWCERMGRALCVSSSLCCLFVNLHHFSFSFSCTNLLENSHSEWSFVPTCSTLLNNQCWQCWTYWADVGQPTLTDNLMRSNSRPSVWCVPTPCQVHTTWLWKPSEWCAIALPCVRSFRVVMWSTLHDWTATEGSLTTRLLTRRNPQQAGLFSKRRYVTKKHGWSNMEKM